MDHVLFLLAMQKRNSYKHTSDFIYHMMHYEMTDIVKTASKELTFKWDIYLHAQECHKSTDDTDFMVRIH